MTLATYILEVDWNNDGDYYDTGEDVTARTQSVTYRRGRDYASQLVGRARAGELTAILDNESGDYNSFNTGSAIAGNIVPGRPVRYRTRTYWLDVDEDGPVGYWRLDESSGDALDKTAGGNDGTVTNAVQGETGLLSGNAATQGSYQFDGTDDVVTIAADSAFENPWASGGSFVCLFNADSDGENDGGRLIHSQNNRWMVYCGDEVAGEINIYFFRDFDGVADGTWRTTTKVAIDTTYRLVITYDEDATTNNPIFYVNGASVGVTETATPVGSAVSDAGKILYIGDNENGDRCFDGHIQEVALFDSILTSTQAAEYNTAATDTHQGYTLWTGFLDKILPKPSIHNAHTVELRAIGPLAYHNDRTVRCAMDTSVASGTAFSAITTAAGVASSTVDTGQDTFDRWWCDDKRMVTALREVEQSEWGYVGEDVDGGIVFEDRHHRLKSPHTSSQATWSDADETLTYTNIEQRDPLRELYNVVTASVRNWTEGGLATLWTSSETGASAALPAGESRVFWTAFPNPQSAVNAVGVGAWTTPVATTDYTVNSQAGGGGADLTGDVSVAVSKFSKSMKITLTSASATLGYVTALKARGTPLTEGDGTRVEEEDSASQTAYGERDWPHPGQWIASYNTAVDHCKAILSIYKDPIPVLRMTTPGSRDSTHLTQVLKRDISERITVTADNKSDLGIDEDFFIEAMTHRVNRNQHHTTTYDLSPAAGFSGGFWVLGTSKLDTETRAAY